MHDCHICGRGIPNSDVWPASVPACACADEIADIREALELIRDLTIACNGGLLQNIHAISQLALDPEGCAYLARIPKP